MKIGEEVCGILSCGVVNVCDVCDVIVPEMLCRWRADIPYIYAGGEELETTSSAVLYNRVLITIISYSLLT